MNTLFELQPDFPEGFTYLPHFITEDEEARLLSGISIIDLHNFSFQGFTANRKVASFGYDYSFDNRGLTKGQEIPRAFDFIIDKVSKQISTTPKQFVELLITQYPAGSVINWHRDAPPFDVIAGISLMSDCTFRLRPQEKTKQTRNNIISFPVKQRSLYVMSGSSRSEWQHSIAPVKQTRYSITLRTLKH
jgi:alkylated DNA repair dioxygenase AlkB